MRDETTLFDPWADRGSGPYASLAAMFLNRVSHFDCVINHGC